LPHELGQGMDAFSWRKRTKAKGQESVAMNQCQHIFLEPLAWMKGVEEGPVEGKLCCPKCDVKLGLFNWVGSRCACGAFVSPAFYVQASKVDVMKCKE
jgi:dual specificity phosphatase 12